MSQEIQFGSTFRTGYTFTVSTYRTVRTARGIFYLLVHHSHQTGRKPEASISKPKSRKSSLAGCRFFSKYLASADDLLCVSGCSLTLLVSTHTSECRSSRNPPFFGNPDKKRKFQQTTTPVPPSRALVVVHSDS